MPRVTVLPLLNERPASGDMVPVVDVSDTSETPEGTTKRVPFANLGPTFLPYRIERALATGKTRSFGAAGLNVRNLHSIFVSPDETKLFALGGNGGYLSDGKIYQLSMSTPGDLNTLTVDGSFIVYGQDSAPQTFTFNSSGTRLYVAGDTGNVVLQYNLGTALEIVASPPTYAGNKDVSAQATIPRGLLLSPDETTMLLGGGSVVYQYTLSTPGEIIGGSMTYAIVTSGAQMQADAMCWAPDHAGTPGKRIFHATGTVVGIRECPTPYSVAGSAGSGTPAFNPDEHSALYGVQFLQGGLKMWVAGPDIITEYYTSAAVPAA